MDGFLTHLECTHCAGQYPADRLHGASACCGRPLYARYDLRAAARAVRREQLAGREASLWRYAELLPPVDPALRVTLGEGWTPLLECPRLGAALGTPRLAVKDEGQMATGSFKARGMSVAVTMARALGASALAAPSAGNAGGALAQYAARAGMPCHVFMPADVPRANQVECVAAGARTWLVRGLIHDCGRLVRRGAAEGRWFDLSTLREPYRVEGKKTMGYELAEQGGWRLPDVVIYPTGGGTGLVGMWKAFAELEALGWIGPERPRMVAVQSEGCAPIVRAFHEGREDAEPWEDARTVAAGLRVPVALGDRLILRALRESGGTAVAVSDGELLASGRLLAAAEGIFPCPEGGAGVAAVRRLREQGWLQGGERVVIFNTGAGVKYLECFPAEVRLLDPDGPLPE
jgi:threonine synthase